MPSRKPLILDTGFFIALFSQKDRHHTKALALRSTIDKRRCITTWPVMTEVCHLLQKFAPHKVSRFLVLLQDGVIEISGLTTHNLPQIISLFEKYGDLPIDLADASLVILAEELSSGEIVSTDQRDFQTYRWKNTRPFRNLMELD